MAVGETTAVWDEAMFAWVRQHMPVTRAICEALPSLQGVRLACSMHLDVKQVVALETLLNKGAALFLTTCNPSTVRDEVVAYLCAQGAEAYAWKDMSVWDYQQSPHQALAWQPSHSCEMGADISLVASQQPQSSLQVALEATGSGIARLQGVQPPYPIFNWDDLPVKEGLHNRFMVGLSTWNCFLEKTQLSLHGKRVLVLGYGLVGQGVASTARAFGGVVSIAERDPARRLEARYAGWHTVADALLLAAETDVLVTATGAAKVVDAAVIQALKDGCFLLNVGHAADEIALEALPERRACIPFVEACRVADKELYLFAGGSMANLTAGPGDSINAFDLTLATMVAGIGFIVSEEARTWSRAVHALPRAVWQGVAEQATQQQGW